MGSRGSRQRARAVCDALIFIACGARKPLGPGIQSLMTCLNVEVGERKRATGHPRVVVYVPTALHHAASRMPIGSLQNMADLVRQHMCEQYWQWTAWRHGAHAVIEDANVNALADCSQTRRGNPRFFVAESTAPGLTSARAKADRDHRNLSLGCSNGVAGLLFQTPSRSGWPSGVRGTFQVLAAGAD